MKFIGSGLRRWEKAKQNGEENFWDQIKSKMDRHILLLHWWI